MNQVLSRSYKSVEGGKRSVVKFEIYLAETQITIETGLKSF